MEVFVSKNIAAAALLMISFPAIAFAMPTMPIQTTNVSTPNGILQYRVNPNALTVTVSSNGHILNTVNEQMGGSKTAVVETPSGSAILMSYNTGGNNDCAATYQWFSLLPGGQYKMSKLFGSCYYLKNIHDQGGNVFYKQISVNGKGYKIMRYSVSNGELLTVSSHMLSASIPKIVVNSWHEYVPVYGKIVEKQEQGQTNYSLDFPTKVEITGNASLPGNLYVSSIFIQKMDVPAGDIGKLQHYVAQISIPMAGPGIMNIRPQ